MKIRGFISYSHEDGSVIATGLTNYLTNLLPNFEPVYDVQVPQGNTIDKIKEKLSLCDIFILLVTPASLNSMPIAEEIKLAKEKGMKIIPCKDHYLSKDWNDLPWDIQSYLGVEFENLDELKRKAYSALSRVLEQLANELQKSIAKNETVKHGISDEELAYIEGEHKKYPWFKFSLSSGTNTYDILAATAGGKIMEVLVDKKALSLILRLVKPNDGLVRIMIPRKLLDSKSKNIDSHFFVLVNGQQVSHRDIPTDTARALLIPVNKNSREIEIIGTEVEGISYMGDVEKENIVVLLPGGGIMRNDTEYLEPKILRTKPGKKVRWINTDTVSHTITSGKVSDDNVGSLFDSGLVKSESTFEVAFNKKGTYDYFCAVHPWKTGKIVVE